MFSHPYFLLNSTATAYIYYNGWWMTVMAADKYSKTILICIRRFRHCPCRLSNIIRPKCDSIKYWTKLIVMKVYCYALPRAPLPQCNTSKNRSCKQRMPLTSWSIIPRVLRIWVALVIHGVKYGLLDEREEVGAWCFRLTDFTKVAIGNCNPNYRLRK